MFLGRHLPSNLLSIGLIVLSHATQAAVLSIGHRGNAMYAPENTLASFLAAAGKADLVETDTHVSSDGVLVIMHDDSVDRTTDGTGNVSSLTLAQLKTFDAGSWFSAAFVGERIPTLAEMVTNTLRFATPLIERKTGTAAQHVAELRRLNAVTNVVVQSFDWNFLAGVHALEPSIVLCGLGSGTLTTASLTSITNAGARTVAWEKAGVTAAEVALVHNWGLKLFVWTVDSPAEIQNFIALGVDGIISNDPASVRGQQVVVTNAPTYLGDRLVAYWKFDDGLTNALANTVADSRGTNTGTLVRNDGASHWFGGSTAKLGGCLRLDGTNAFVTIPQTASLDINTNALSFSAWVWLTKLPSQLATSYGAIFDSTNDCYVLYLDKANKELRFKVTDVSGHAARPGIPEASLQTNQWLHIVATYSGSVTPSAGRASIYLNGQLRDTHTGNDNTAPTGLIGNVKPGQAAAMGREGPTGGNYFTGMVDDIALWKRALSAQEVTDLYQAGLAGQSLGVVLGLPTPLIELSSIRTTTSGDSLELQFRNLGPWQTFKLMRADMCNGPFQVVEGVAPTALSGGGFSFVCPLNGKSGGYFRVQCE
jgi:glycerophosphoryl diester phosphodiesterase